MGRFKKLLVEVHQRSVWQALAVYLGASYAVLEAAAYFRDEFGLPGWLPPVALVLLLIGLPVVVLTALAREEVYGGEVPAGDVAAAAEEDRRLRLLTWRTAGLSFLGALALWGIIAAGLLATGTYERSKADERRSIAVLPFENQSPDPDDAYFADGMHEEIISQLSKIASLKVISRPSVMEYRERETSLRTIADELGVTHVLEGSVRRAGDDVRITTQLIEAADDAQLWAESYERELRDIFQVQADVARQVTAALRATLTPEEIARIEAQPTDNLEAYEFYLRGVTYLGAPGSGQNLRGAASMFAEAIARDPEFAGAHAALSRTYSTLYFDLDRSDERLALALDEAHAAIEIDPDLPDAYRALSYYHYYGNRDYERALEAIDIAREKGLAGRDYYESVALVQRRQGDFDGAIASLRLALDQDPRSSRLHWQLGTTHLWRRSYVEAERSYDQAFLLAYEPVILVHKARLYVAWQGDRRRAWEALRAGPTVPLDLLIARDVAASWALFRILYPNAAEAQATLRANRSELNSERYYLAYAELAGRLGRRDEASAHYDSARAVLTSLLEELPGDAMYLGELGIAYAGLGRHEEAVRAGEQAVRLLPLSSDVLNGTEPVAYMARIRMMVGDHDSAISDLEVLLQHPGWMSSQWLRLDPVWAPLRDDPRFQALLEKYDQPAR